MKRIVILFISAAITAAMLSGCANSSFNKAVDTNTQRQQDYLDGYLEQAANDLTAINDCWVNVKKTNAESVGCMMMSMALRMTNTFLYAFLGKPDMTRVPAAPEEIIESVLTKSMKFAITKYGFDAVRKVVESGQVAQAQIAQASISAQSQQNSNLTGLVQSSQQQAIDAAREAGAASAQEAQGIGPITAVPK